jgi:hypothetical protein
MRIRLLGYLVVFAAIFFSGSERLSFATSAESNSGVAAVESHATGAGSYLAIALSLAPIVLLYESLEKRKADNRR